MSKIIKANQAFNLTCPTEGEFNFFMKYMMLSPPMTFAADMADKHKCYLQCKLLGISGDWRVYSYPAVIGTPK